MENKTILGRLRAMFCAYGPRIMRELQLLRQEVQVVKEEIRRVCFFVHRPNAVSVFPMGENDMAIKFAVVLPAPPAEPKDWAEIVAGKLSVKIGDGEPLEFDTDKAAQEVEPRHFVNDAFIGEQGTLVELIFRYVDDAGNIGPAATAVQELMDTVPPVAPDSIGLAETEEV